MIGAMQPASSIRFLISGTAAAASGTLTVHRTISEPASASSSVCFSVVPMSAVSVFVMDCTTMGAPPPTRTCPTFTPYVLRRGCRLAVASNPSICVSIPLNSNLIWPSREIVCAHPWRLSMNESPLCPANDCGTSQLRRRRGDGALEEREQVGVNGVGLSRGHAVRKALVGFQCAILQQLCRQRSRIGIRHDLVVIAMHHQDRHSDLLQVLGEVRLREGDDAVIMRLCASHHALAPPIPDHRLRRFRPRPVVTIERSSWQIVIELGSAC